MRIDIYHHHVPDPSLLRWLTRINNNVEKLMSDIDDFVTLATSRIAAQKTQIDGVAALLASIKHQLADALAGENLSPAAKTKLAAIMPALETNTAEITDAINANTDAAPIAPAPTAAEIVGASSTFSPPPPDTVPPNPISFGTPPSSSPKEA